MEKFQEKDLVIEKPTEQDFIHHIDSIGFKVVKEPGNMFGVYDMEGKYAGFTIHLPNPEKSTDGLCGYISYNKVLTVPLKSTIMTVHWWGKVITFSDKDNNFSLILKNKWENGLKTAQDTTSKEITPL